MNAVMTSGFVDTEAIKAAIHGHEMDVLKALRITLRGNGHIDCPYPDHGGAHDWRWDANAKKARCTCIDGGDDIFTVVQKVRRIDFPTAKLFIAETAAPDLIKKAKAGSNGCKTTKVERALNPPKDRIDTERLMAYPAARLGLSVDQLVRPSTRYVGDTARPLYARPEAESNKPALIGAYPCLIFEAISNDGRAAAFQIFLGPDGDAKAVIEGPDREIINPKLWVGKEQQADRLAGCAVWFGDRKRATTVYVSEGIEDAFAVAVIYRDEIESGEAAVAAAIATAGVENFEPTDQMTDIVIVADRDEKPNVKGKVSMAGERAARKFALKHRRRVRVRIALPGNPGTKADVLTMVEAEGWGATAKRIANAVPFEPTAIELAQAQRPSIVMKAGGLSETFDKAVGLLAGADDVFQRGNMLVQVRRLSEPTARDGDSGVERTRDSLVITAMKPEAVQLKLARMAEWMRQDQNGTVYRTDPPAKLAGILVSVEGEWKGIRHLISTTEIPLITTNGRIIDKPGLDQVSGVLFDPGDTAFPQVPNRPTRKQAKKALAELMEPLAGFPFIDDAGMSTMLSMILTLFCRPFLRAAPIFIITAPKMGSGKTLLATLAGYVASGQAPAMMSQAKDEESERKRVLALLLEGSAVSVIDNISRPLESDVMCSVLTEPLYKDRMLGFSKVATVPTSTVWAATGNNLMVAGDLTTRGLVIKIDPATENPEERAFERDLHQWVPANRGRLAAAALTIMRAYHVAGRPLADKLPVFGRFEAWSAMVREPLVWLDMADPYVTKKLLEEHDPERETIANVLIAWEAAFGDSNQTAGSALQSARQRAEATPHQTPDTELLDAINDAIPSRNGVTTRAFGKWLAKQEGRIEGGLKVESIGEEKRAKLWRVVFDRKNSSAFGEYGGQLSRYDADSGEFGEFSEFVSSQRVNHLELKRSKQGESRGSRKTTHQTHQTHRGGEFEI